MITLSEENIKEIKYFFDLGIIFDENYKISFFDTLINKVRVLVVDNPGKGFYDFCKVRNKEYFKFNTRYGATIIGI